MMYELTMTYDDGTMKKEQAELPNLMCALSIYMEDNSWIYAEITNLRTGELIATWENDKVYGVTTMG